ncbi:MAG: iron export ABC transporter permease subunit FetB [Magnetococcales bacterium]|nr:iron export ABC transporter permease subunit FetB [Magnetococcales bacterium]
MNIIVLSPFDLSLAAMLVLVLAGLVHLQGIPLGRQIAVSALRTVVQLSLIGLVLKSLFNQAHPGWMALLACVMLLAAGREVSARQERRLRGWWGYGIGLSAMFLSSFVVTVLALMVIISPSPWYTPQYAVPLLGMMLGNTMTSISLGLDRLNSEAWRDRAMIETRLALGHTSLEAIRPIRRRAIRSGLIPAINAMAAAGLVSLPGMMTGQILGGNPPMVAVKYQILIMFMIAAGTGFGTMAAVWFGIRRLFDQRQRLRLDRLTHDKEGS